MKELKEKFLQGKTPDLVKYTFLWFCAVPKSTLDRGRGGGTEK